MNSPSETSTFPNAGVDPSVVGPFDRATPGTVRTRVRTIVVPTGFPMFFIMVLLGPVATRSAMGDLPWVVGTVVVLLGPIPLLRWSPARGWIARLSTEQKSIVRRLRSLVVDCE